MLFCLKYDKKAHSRKKYIMMDLVAYLKVVCLKYNAYIIARGRGAWTKLSPNKMDPLMINKILFMLNLTNFRRLVTPICLLFGVKFMLNM